MREDTPYTFAAGDFGFTDPHDLPADRLLAVQITTLPGAGTLTAHGAPVTGGQFISLADLTTGQVVFTPAADANGAAYATFTFQVQDDGGTANGGVALDPTPKTLTLNVTPVNDAPSFTKGSDQTVPENAGPQTVARWATAITAGPPDEAGQALTFLVSADNPAFFTTLPALAPDGTLTY